MRMLLCPTCGAKPVFQKQHPEDAAFGFKWRRVEIPRAKKPKIHHITINGEAQAEMRTLHCDSCSTPIEDGSPAVAITQWRTGKMGPWENEYSEEVRHD